MAVRSCPGTGTDGPSPRRRLRATGPPRGWPGPTRPTASGHESRVSSVRRETALRGALARRRHGRTRSSKPGLGISVARRLSCRGSASRVRRRGRPESPPADTRRVGVKLLLTRDVGCDGIRPPDLPRITLWRAGSRAGQAPTTRDARHSERNYQSYLEDLKRRKGEEADQSHRTSDEKLVPAWGAPSRRRGGRPVGRRARADVATGRTSELRPESTCHINFPSDVTPVRRHRSCGDAELNRQKSAIAEHRGGSG